MHADDNSTSLPGSVRVTMPEHVLARELDGELVILNLESERYFGLDEVGTRFWRALEESDSLAGALQRLQAEYGLGETQLRGDMAMLLDELRDHGLVKLSEQPHP